MIKNILLLISIVLLAWMSRDYFSIALPLIEEIKTIEYMQNNDFKKAEIVESKSPKPDVQIDKTITLSMLLSTNRFYDALVFYLEKNTDKNMKQMENYLRKVVQSNPSLALEYMQLFLENEPKISVLKLMIKTYINEGDLPKAIELIMQAKENYISEKEDKRLSTQLREVAILHIDKLMERKEYARLISFLEDMIAYDSTESFYSYRLAQLYMRLERVEEAGELLDELQYDEVYAQNVKTLLSTIDKEEEESYKYAIPLRKYGDHYTVNVFLDGVEFDLILDTGATYIFIDEDKASMLEVIRDDLTLKTAGNEISAKLCQASTMQTGNLQLSNIKVTIAPFKREGVDGLLGMNFFKQFKFFIDQDANMLYLDPK